jgi:hypothetical protein
MKIDDKGTVWNEEARKEMQIGCPLDKLGEQYKRHA